MKKIGIGVITYNRLNHLKNCINSIKKNTIYDYDIVVADDGSNDGTIDWCKQEKISVVTGLNRGVCWNKNRALYFLKEYTDADCIILIEDDCIPVEKNWDSAWSKLTLLWKHVNYAAPWLLDNSLVPTKIYQKGNESQPYIINNLTGQCTSSSRQSIDLVGYLDTRFVGYGHGHIEWTKRFMRCKEIQESMPFYIDGFYPACDIGLKTVESNSYANDDQKQKNLETLKFLLKNESIYRDPWNNDEEKKYFLKEINNALSLF